MILKFLLHLFEAAVEPAGGIVMFVPLRLRLLSGRFREPDLLLLLDAADPRNQERYWLGADLVVEIVSTDKPERDLIQKREEYALAGIAEYWIVNPLDRTISVLALDGERYAGHGVFRPDDRADSPLLPGFTVGVTDLFAAQ